jgi:hypothetical protein
MNSVNTTRSATLFVASICTVFACVALSGTAHAGKSSKPAAGNVAATTVAKRPVTSLPEPRNVPSKRAKPRLNQQGEIEKPGARVEP